MLNKVLSFISADMRASKYWASENFFQRKGLILHNIIFIVLSAFAFLSWLDLTFSQGKFLSAILDASELGYYKERLEQDNIKLFYMFSTLITLVLSAIYTVYCFLTRDADVIRSDMWKSNTNFNPIIISIINFIVSLLLAYAFFWGGYILTVGLLYLWSDFTLVKFLQIMFAIKAQSLLGGVLFSSLSLLMPYPLKLK